MSIYLGGYSTYLSFFCVFQGLYWLDLSNSIKIISNAMGAIEILIKCPEWHSRRCLHAWGLFDGKMGSLRQQAGGDCDADRGTL
jgi:hypothetical protein